jgi:hypothetical protein
MGPKYRNLRAEAEPASDHRFQLGDNVKILRGAGNPVERLIDHHMPDDHTVYRVIRLLPLDISGPLYHLAAPDGTLRLAHESQLAAAD